MAVAEWEQAEVASRAGAWRLARRFIWQAIIKEIIIGVAIGLGIGIALLWAVVIIALVLSA